MILVILFVTLSLIGIALIAIVNAITFPRLETAMPISNKQPSVSLLIPARNEAAVIGQTIRNLLAQTYPRFEVILLDDDSDDDTVSMVRAAGQDDPHLKILTGARLPSGWLGKNWACHQLAQAARGEWLIFTDADVRWTPPALVALAAEMERSQADLLAVWPTQQTITWGERLVVPLMALAVLGYLPLPLVHHTRRSSLAARPRANSWLFGARLTQLLAAIALCATKFLRTCCWRGVSKGVDCACGWLMQPTLSHAACIAPGRKCATVLPKTSWPVMATGFYG
jgi:cellulose synthase/poly-beta-1,6-N-acetylglucosamine synthase-like glycosyltransferase